MKEYASTVVINASQAHVWSILTDAAGYKDWNPEIVNIDGAIAAGARITARVTLGDGAVRSVPQTVTSLEPPARMEWVGGLPLGLFVGRRIYTLTPGPGGVEFRLHVQMSGLLSPLILKSVGDRQPMLDSFSAALKKRAESA
jgi:hypothetical protein